MAVARKIQPMATRLSNGDSTRGRKTLGIADGWERWEIITASSVLSSVMSDPNTESVGLTI